MPFARPRSAASALGLGLGCRGPHRTFETVEVVDVLDRLRVLESVDAAAFELRGFGELGDGHGDREPRAVGLGLGERTPLYGLPGNDVAQTVRGGDAAVDDEEGDPALQRVEDDFGDAAEVFVGTEDVSVVS